ncbi:MAG TPA: polysaccharide biosynthesis/export family protein [Candidatus Sulfotelmatobacter sp.]|nr:polysaccharide biosynthesis/export family protein [Candidatus Sulfotelmatobacter sp.]
MGVTVRGVPDWLKAKPAYWLLLICLGAQAAYGQEKVATPQQTNEKIQQLAKAANAHPADTPVGVGDLLHIEVFDVPELTRETRVTDTGAIGFPLIPGRIQAAGLTPYQIERELEKLLLENGLVSHPQVSVLVKEQNSQPVSVVGAVVHPMVYQIIKPTTLLEVLAAAGGIADTAGSIIMITRPLAKETSNPGDQLVTTGGGDTQTITIQLQDLLETGNSAYNIQIFGGDVVSVPRAGIVYVLGAGISQPGGYVVQGHGEQITVLKAVALAHGLNGFAKADDSVLFRMNPSTGKRDEIHVHIKQISKNRTEDLAMKADDILYIPDSTGKKVLARGAEAAVSVGTAVAIFRTGNY